MRLLLDTHTFLWLVEGDSDQLSERVQKFLQDEETTAILSIVSLWELAIKSSSGKLMLYISRFITATCLTAF